MDEKLLKIIDYYGVQHQQRKLAEEFLELEEAITVHELKETVSYEIPLTEIVGTREHIIEELADVMVLLTQFKEYYQIDGNEILDVMKKKIDRQLQRMQE